MGNYIVTITGSTNTYKFQNYDDAINFMSMVIKYGKCGSDVFEDIETTLKMEKGRGLDNE